MSAAPPSTASASAFEPVWQIAELYPYQGEWTVEDYLAIPGNRLIEFDHGRVEFLAMPTQFHQIILSTLHILLNQYLNEQGIGIVLTAGMKVRTSEKTFREPDLVVMLHENAHKRGEQFWEGADMAVEIVSPDDPQRDLVLKREEYAACGIREYWIVDPRDQSIAVLTLEQSGARYQEAGRYRTGETAVSVLLDGFAAHVDEVFARR